jgi:hypothetical protein
LLDSFRSARLVASGRRTLEEHEAFAEGVLSGAITVPERPRPSWRTIGAAGLLAAGAFALGFILGPGDEVAPSRIEPGRAADASGEPPKPFELPTEQKLALGLVRARQQWIGATTVTREQRLNAGEVADGFCVPSDDRAAYECNLSHLGRRPEIPKALLERAGIQPGEIPERPTYEVEFELRVANDGCWHAWVTVNGSRSDPSRASDLRGCVVS